MTVIVSLYYLSQSNSARRIFWFLVGLFVIHFIISGAIIFGLKDTIDSIKDYIGYINSYFLILCGVLLIIYSFFHTQYSLRKSKVSINPQYYTALPFGMGIIAPFIDFPALVEYVFLAIQINVLFDSSVYRIIANTGLNIAFHIPIIIFWVLALTEQQSSIQHIHQFLHRASQRVERMQPYIGVFSGLLLIGLGILLYINTV